MRLAVLKATGETSRRLPTGSFWKRGDDAPSRFAVAEGVEDTTARNRDVPPTFGMCTLAFVGLLACTSSHVDESSTEGSELKAIRTSRQPS